MVAQQPRSISAGGNRKGKSEGEIGSIALLLAGIKKPHGPKGPCGFSALIACLYLA